MASELLARAKAAADRVGQGWASGREAAVIRELVASIEALEADLVSLCDMMSDMDMSHSEHVKLNEIMARSREAKP